MIEKIEIDMAVAGTKTSSIYLTYTDSNGVIREEKITDYFMCIGGGGLGIEVESIDEEGLIICHEKIMIVYGQALLQILEQDKKLF